MGTDRIGISIKGKIQEAKSVEICSSTIAITGRRFKTAAILDEEWLEGKNIPNPKDLISGLICGRHKVDLFTFAQRVPETQPKYSHPLEWDNVAAIAITTFKDWWENRLSQDARKNVRRAEKRGVQVRVIEFNDKLVQGIQGIYNETPVRQGKPFWHYGKDFETVKRENGTFLERSEFIGAYLEEELIGFIKMVYVDRVASLMQILAKDAHHDKRPMNALIAKAVEICEQKHMSHFLYGKFTYGNKNQSSLTEFKRRTAFEQINFPRYYVPLTLKGELFVRLRLYRGAGGLLPEPMLRTALACRAWYCRMLPANNLKS